MRSPPTASIPSRSPARITRSATRSPAAPAASPRRPRSVRTTKSPQQSSEQARDARPVAAAEQTRVRGEWIELMERDPIAPAEREWRDLLVALDEAIGQAAEQLEHRDVDLAMTAVDRGIEDRRLVVHRAGVARPQIAVQARRWFGRTEQLGPRTQRIELALDAELRTRA